MQFRGYCSSAQSPLVVVPTLQHQSLYGLSEFPASARTIPAGSSEKHLLLFSDVGKPLTCSFWKTAMFVSWYLMVLLRPGWRNQQVPSLKREIYSFFWLWWKTWKEKQVHFFRHVCATRWQKAKQIGKPPFFWGGKEPNIAFDCLLIGMLEFDSSGWVEKALFFFFFLDAA